MYKDPTEFRKGFKNYKKTGISPYKNGRRLSDEEYVRIMEKVAADNWQKWGEDNEDAALTRILNDNVYDYRGYYSKYPNSAANADAHWNDEFKTVWHPTFSNQSKYSGKKSQYNPYGYPGGTWQGELFNPQWYQQSPHGPGFYKDGYPKLPKFGLGTEGGYTRQNGNPVKFDEEGNLVDQVTGQKGTMMLPEVVVTPRRYDAYHSVYSFNPSNVWKYFLPNNAKKLYNTIDPNYPYGGVSAYLDYHLGTNNRKSVMQRDIDTGFSNKDLANIFYNSTEAAFAKYLGLTDKDFQTKSGIKNDKISNYLLPADYTPAKGRTYKNIYKLVHPVGINESSNGDDLIPLLNDYIFAQMVERGKGKSINAISSSLKDAGIPVDTLKINRNYEPIITGQHAFNNITGGDYTIGLGNDANGPYISYYDEYDLNSGIFGQHKLGDIGMSISNPFSLYDRKYFTKDDSTRIVNAYRKFGEKAFDKFGKLRPLQRMNSE